MYRIEKTKGNPLVQLNRFGKVAAIRKTNGTLLLKLKKIFGKKVAQCQKI